MVDVLAQEGFSLEDWDIDPPLREYGPWTGVAVRRGHAVKAILLTPFVFGECPLALLFPWVRRNLGVIKMAVVARDAGGGGSELLVEVYDWEDEGFSSGLRAIAKMLDEIRVRMVSLDVLLAGPEEVDSYDDLPDDHPLQTQQWERVRKAAKRQARRRWG